MGQYGRSHRSRVGVYPDERAIAGTVSILFPAALLTRCIRSAW
jgi:hypothetical protein